MPTAAQAAAFDALSIQERGVPEAALMENAGRQAALIVNALYPDPDAEFVALAGPGNNGGDALVCLRALAAWGRRVSGAVVGNRPAADPVLHGWSLPLGVTPERLDRASVVIDGLLGTGVRGAPRPPVAEWIDAVNGAGVPVVALDTPSGVDGSTGRIEGAAIQAELTVAFGWPKLGTLLYPGRERAGRIVAVEIGFPPQGDLSDSEPDSDSGSGSDPGSEAPWAELITPEWTVGNIPRRPAVTHKNAVGAVAVVAGSAMPGAAVLAVRAAFRCGAGLVRACGGSLLAEVAGAVPEALVVDANDRGALWDAVAASNAIVLGPGLGTGAEARRQIERVLDAREGRPLLADADALTLLARGAAGGLARLAGEPVLVTPHPGEMARLVGASVAEVQQDRVAAARGLAAKHGIAVLLKGAPAMVAGPDGRLMIATVPETSDLAVAGMGDVLAGAAGAFMAQGAPPTVAAALALDVTGRAASMSKLGAALMPSDVVEEIPNALAGTEDSGRRAGTDAVRDFPFVTFDQAAPR